MIGKLKGKIDYIEKDHLIIDVNGVGYIVYCSSKILNNFNKTDNEIELIIETHVREDHINLYGFTSYNERNWFRSLLTAKGVGSKVALAILGVLTTDQISSSISNGDKLAFTQVPGIGVKLAERIIIELKDKIINLRDIFSQSTNITENSNQKIVSDALSALINLGYNRAEAYNVANRLYVENSEITVGNLIKISLKELNK